jgi:hypothetical protein
MVSQNVRLIFVNKTNAKLDSLVANGVFIGTLQKDSVSKVVLYDHLLSDSSGSEMMGKANWNNERLASYSFSFCGTGPFDKITNVDLTYHITIFTIDGQRHLRFEYKR